MKLSETVRQNVPDSKIQFGGSKRVIAGVITTALGIGGFGYNMKDSIERHNPDNTESVSPYQTDRSLNTLAQFLGGSFISVVLMKFGTDLMGVTFPSNQPLKIKSLVPSKWNLWHRIVKKRVTKN